MVLVRTPAFEAVTLTVSLNLGKKVTWNFLRARVKFATLGLDFLSYFKLTINFAKNSLQTKTDGPHLDGNPQSSVAPSGKFEKSPHSEPALTDPELNLDEVPISIQSLEKLFLRYADVFEATF